LNSKTFWVGKICGEVIGHFISSMPNVDRHHLITIALLFQAVVAAVLKFSYQCITCTATLNNIYGRFQN